MHEVRRVTIFLRLELLAQKTHQAVLNYVSNDSLSHLGIPPVPVLKAISTGTKKIFIVEYLYAE